MRLLGYAFAAAVFVLASTSCKGSGFKGSGVVAMVGDEEITREMVALRAKALRGAPAEAADAEPVALAQLIQGYLSLQILDHYGTTVSAPSARAFWADQPLPQSALAVTLGTRDDLYLRALAKPDYASWLLDASFLWRPELLHKESQVAMRLHADLLKSPAAIDTLAAREGLLVDRNWIGVDTIRPYLPAQAGATARVYSPDEKREATEVYRALTEVKAGELYPELVNTANTFQIFRVELRTKNELLLAAITIPKPNFNAWFLTQAAAIEVELRDRELGKGFLKAVPWARRINVKNSDDYPEFFFPSSK